MCCPRPVVPRAMSAASTPFTAIRPTARSAMGTPHFTGLPLGSPVTLMMPLMPWAMRSKPGRSAYGPVCPNPEMLA